MKRIKIIEVLKTNTFGINVNIKGWVRTSRRGKDLIFVELNDGSTIHNIQIVIDTKIIKEDSLKLITTELELSDLNGCKLLIFNIINRHQPSNKSKKIPLSHHFCS